MTENDHTPWYTEEPASGFEITSTERCWIKSPRKGTEQSVSRRQKIMEEKTNGDQPHADRAKSRDTTRCTARHEDLHRRPRIHSAREDGHEIDQ